MEEDIAEQRPGTTDRGDIQLELQVIGIGSI